MAAITQAKTLAVTLTEHTAKTASEHAWIDPDHGLVAGIFPVAHVKYDFVAERLVPLGGPRPPKKKIDLTGAAKRVGEIYEIETADAIYRVGSATQMLIEGLNIIEDIFPGTIAGMPGKKRTKQVVAKTRSELYDIPHPDSHSALLKNGYFVATNNKSIEALGYLREAAQQAGLEWGKSFIVRRA